MAEIRDAALLLRRIPYGETSLIVHVLSAEHGRLSLMARGARRATSPFRATLAPLYALKLAWRPGRSGMGCLTDTQRGRAMVSEARMLEGLQINALAAGLFHEGDPHGFMTLCRALAVMNARPGDSGMLAAAWYLLGKEGWLGQLDHCWHCGKRKDVLIWNEGELCCRGCGAGAEVSTGLRRGILGHMDSPTVYLPGHDLMMWRRMIQDVLHCHGLKPLLLNGGISGDFGRGGETCASGREH